MMSGKAANDPRIPIRLVSAEAVGRPVPRSVALLVPEGLAVEGGAVERVGTGPRRHAPGCVCCAPRVAVAEALNRLFVRRARGEVAWFGEVLAALPREAVEAGLTDVLVSARFRIDLG